MSLVFLIFVAAISPALAETPSEPRESDETEGLSSFLEDAGEALDFSQREEQERFDFGLGVNLGPILPWTKWGASFLWKGRFGINSFSIGIGDFEFSDNYRERNYRLDVESQNAYYALRVFPLGFGPLYIEPMAGLVHWKGDIQPQGDDPLRDELASALSSRYDHRGLSLGASLGLMWIFSNRVFLDYNFLGVSKSIFLKEFYSVNTSEARANVRRQIEGPLSFTNAHIRIGWSWRN